MCLLGPIAFDIVGPAAASQAIGFLLGTFSIPFTVGPPVAGKELLISKYYKVNYRSLESGLWKF